MINRFSSGFVIVTAFRKVARRRVSYVLKLAITYRIVCVSIS